MVAVVDIYVLDFVINIGGFFRDESFVLDHGWADGMRAQLKRPVALSSSTRYRWRSSRSARRGLAG